MRSVSVNFKPSKQKESKDDNQRRAGMANIYVKCKPGRRHYYEGRVIPTDKFVPVDGNDPLIQRAIHHWHDLEVEGGEGEAPKPGDPILDNTLPIPEGGARSAQSGRQQPERRRARPDDPPLAPEHRQPSTPRE
jgi:hypothetical protein